MIAHVDVLGTQAETWKPSNFKCPRVILKNLAVLVELHIGNTKFMFPSFLDELHEGNDVRKGHTHGYVLSFCHEKCNLWLQVGGPYNRAVWIRYDPSTLRFGSAWISCYEFFVPIACEVIIATALEIFGRIWLDNVQCDVLLLSIWLYKLLPHHVQSLIGRVLGALIDCI